VAFGSCMNCIAQIVDIVGRIGRAAQCIVETGVWTVV